MTHLPYVVAAYTLTIAGTVGVLWWSYASMRRAERRADTLGGRR